MNQENKTNPNQNLSENESTASEKSDSISIPPNPKYKTALCRAF